MPGYEPGPAGDVPTRTVHSQLETRHDARTLTITLPCFLKDGICVCERLLVTHGIFWAVQGLKTCHVD